jgi:hypothetical protein
MCAVDAGRWPRTVDYGFVIPALVSPGSACVRTYKAGSEPAASEVKVVCGKGTNWLLFGADFVPKLRPVEHALTINIKEEAL